MLNMRIKSSFKNTYEFIFGVKLPCGHGKRLHPKLGERVKCGVCGKVQTRIRFV